MNMEKIAYYLEEFLEQEVDEIGNSGGRSTEHDRFCVYRVCFESLIDKLSTYKDLLFRIKSEYETCIAAIERGQREAPYLSAKLASAVLEPETLRNYRKRRNELELKVALLRTCNGRLHSKIRTPRMSRGEEKSYLRFIHTKSRTPASVLLSDGLSCRSRPRVVPSLSVQQLTDVVFLRKKLAQLEVCVAQTKVEHETRFLPKQMKGHLFTRLQGKEVIKEELLNKREDLKMRIMSLKLSLAVEENKFNISSRRRKGRAGFSNLARALKETQDTMVKADELCEEESEDKREKPNSSNEVYAQPSLPNIQDDDDPRSDREAEFILEYIEKFAESFAKGQVQDAALAAAYSPKGSLRTPETLQKFKEYDFSYPGRSLCLEYWEALLPTVSTGCPKPSDWETKECVACALDKGRSDLLTHWIAQDQLTLSEEVGQLIRDACHCDESCICGLTGLAEAVFEKVGVYKEVIHCLVRQGRFHRAVSYMDDHSDLSKADLFEAFRNCPPSDGFMSFLTTECNQSLHLLSLEQVIYLLVQKTDDLKLIKEYINNAILSGSEINVTGIMRVGEEEFTLETYDKWDCLSENLRVHGLHELAEELLSLAFVSYACYRARINSRRHPPSRYPREP